jgi:hypothetical protein
VTIYLLHEIMPSAFKRLGLMTTDIAVGLGHAAGADQPGILRRDRAPGACMDPCAIGAAANPIQLNPIIV